jgi:O-acetyl-ADP-ribose deacetylase (regulator of RNase III)
VVEIIEQDIARVGELPRSPGEKIAIAHGVNCQGRMGSGVAKILVH